MLTVEEVVFLKFPFSLGDPQNLYAGLKNSGGETAEQLLRMKSQQTKKMHQTMQMHMQCPSTGLNKCGRFK